MKNRILPVVLLLIMTSIPVFPQSVSNISDSDKVLYAIDMLRLGIQQGEAELIEAAVCGNLTIGDTTLQPAALREKIDSVFRIADVRETAIPRPSCLKPGGFWDFTIEDVQMADYGDSCLVTCRFRLYACLGRGESLYESAESLRFERVQGGWFLRRTDRLFRFLIESVER